MPAFGRNRTYSPLLQPPPSRRWFLLDLGQLSQVGPPARIFALYSPILKAVPARTCLVSFTDSEGIEHSVRVPAESLYEAAVEAMAAFRRSALVEMPLGSAPRLTIKVKAPEEEHTITIGKVLAWLDGVAISPSEKLKKNRLKERLRT